MESTRQRFRISPVQLRILSAIAEEGDEIEARPERPLTYHSKWPFDGAKLYGLYYHLWGLGYDNDRSWEARSRYNSIQRSVTRLQRRGLIEESRLRRDREALFRITPAGRAYLETHPCPPWTPPTPPAAPVEVHPAPPPGRDRRLGVVAMAVNVLANQRLEADAQADVEREIDAPMICDLLRDEHSFPLSYVRVLLNELKTAGEFTRMIEERRRKITAERAEAEYV